MRKILSGVLFLLLMITVSGCSADSSPKKDCAIDSIMLDKRSFPEGSTEEPIGEALVEASPRSAGRYINYIGTIVYHDVVDFSSEGKADDRYDQLQRAGFIKDYKPWEEQSLEIPNTIVDEMKLICSDAVPYMLCYFTARYNTIVTFLTFTSTNKDFNMSNVEKAITDLDKKISSCRYSDKLKIFSINN